MEHDIAARTRRGHIVLLTVLAVWAVSVAIAAQTGSFSGVYPLLLAGLIALGIIIPVVAYALSRGFRDYIEVLGLRRRCGRYRQGRGPHTWSALRTFSV